MFYHILLTTDNPEEKHTRTQTYYSLDLSELQLDEFLQQYRRGMPLAFKEGRVVSPSCFKSIEIGFTEQASTILLPPLRVKFHREAAFKKAEEEERNRRNRIAVYNPYDTSGFFFADRTLMSLAKDRTEEFIQPFTTTPESHRPSGNPDLEAEAMNGHELIALKQRRRFRYLEYLYQTSASDSSRMFHWREVGKALGMRDDVAAVACCYLRQKKLANGEFMTDGISQTGIDEYEQAVRKPDQPTDHFDRQVTINTGHNANVMLNSPGAHQTLTTAALPADIADVADLIREIRQALPHLSLAQDIREDAELFITDLQAQLEMPNPDRRKVRAGLRSVGHILGNLSLNVTANALTEPILTHLHRLLLLFASSTC